MLDDSLIPFNVTRSNSDVENDMTIIKIEKSNMSQKGTISITKMGEIFSSVKESNDIYQPVYDTAQLAGAKYNIVANEDIYTFDGTLRAKKGEIVDTVITKAEEIVTSKPLYLGKYKVLEIESPFGMVKNKDVYEFELTYAGQNVEITKVENTFYNERQKVEISLNKVLEIDKDYEVGNNGEILNVSFGLYADETLTANDGSVIPQDELIEIVTVTENGSAKILSDLPLGRFYLKELTSDEAYKLSDTKYEIVFDYAGQDTEVVKIKANNDKDITNKMIRGNIVGKKITEDGIGLGNVVIGIFKTGTTKFTKENAIKTVITKDDGSFEFTQVPFGNWIVKEIQTVKGFVLLDEEIPVTINEDKQNVEIEMLNYWIKGNITLTKVDKEYPENHLTGAVFKAYRDTNNNEKLDNEDELLGTLEELENGVYQMKGIRYGRIFVKEEIAPQGFVIDDNVYTVFISENDKTYSIENKAGIGFINSAIKGNITLTKVDEEYPENHLTGAIFEVYRDTNNNGELDKEDKLLGTLDELEDGIYEMKNIRYGLIFVKEKTAPDGFLLDEKVYSIFISENGKTYNIENEADIGFINNVIKGNITLTKVDEEYPENYLTGAIFEVYRDTNDNKELDNEDELLGTLEELENGIYEMNAIRYGRVFVKEKIAPVGFLLDENVYTVFISENNKTYNITNNSGESFANKAINGAIKIKKTSKDGKLAGFTFVVTGKTFDGKDYEEKFITNEKGEILVENLRIGEYVIYEESNENNIQYILPDPQTVKIEDKGVIEVEFYNDLIETPKTRR